MPASKWRAAYVPVQQLLSKSFGHQRACLVNPDKALASPVAPGDPFAGSGGCTPAAPTTPGLEQLGQSFAIVDTSPLDPSIKISPDIGAATGLQFLGNGQVLAAAELVRRGGGSAGVVHPAG